MKNLQNILVVLSVVALVALAFVFGRIFQTTFDKQTNVKFVSHHVEKLRQENRVLQGSDVILKNLIRQTKVCRAESGDKTFCFKDPQNFYRMQNAFKEVR